MIDDKERAFLDVGFALDDWWRVTGSGHHYGCVVIGIGPNGVDIQWFGDRKLSMESIRDVVAAALDQWDAGGLRVDMDAAVDFDR